MPPEEPFKREPITPAKQKRLDALLAHAQQKITGDKPDYDYATELLTQCVLGNPRNIFYVKAYIENLQKKYNNNKTGSTFAKIKELGSRNAQKKAFSDGHWDEVIRQGLKVLTVNPWDKVALSNMAIASKKSEDFEVELYYLKTALVANQKDADINKLCGIALGERGDLDQAIVCWHRVEQADPSNEEAKHNITRLNEQRMGRKGTGPDPRTDQLRRVSADGVVEELLTPEKKLLHDIAQHPKQMGAYLELSQLYFNEERYADAENILAKAFEESDGDAEIREKWEDAELRHLRQKIAFVKDPVEKKAQEKAYFLKEVEVFKNRCERYPNDMLFRYELGYRYMLLKQYNEAIRELQSARHDPRKKGLCLMALGQCFQQIKQYRLAIDHYELAIQEIPDRDAANKKKALHLAGKLALGLKDLELAEKHLSLLAGMDFNYKDVPALLDKLAQLRQNGPSGHSDAAGTE